MFKIESYSNFKAKPKQHKASDRSKAKIRTIQCTEALWQKSVFTDKQLFILDKLDGLRCYWYDLWKEPYLLSRRVLDRCSKMIFAGNNLKKNKFCFRGGKHEILLSSRHFYNGIFSDVAGNKYSDLVYCKAPY